MKKFTLVLFLGCVGSAAAVDYKTQVEPIFRNKCYACHSVTKKVKGDMALDKEKLSEHIGPDKAIIPGDPVKSQMVVSVKLPDDDDAVMPPKGKNRLTEPEVAILEAWIKEGASTGAGTASAPPPGAPAATAPAAGAAQSWVNTAGVTIQATFMGLQGDGVLLKISETQVTHLVPLSSLSPESQAQAKAAR
jgi:mono/diheme cytochrome c family protein